MLHSNFETFGLDKVTMTEQIKDANSNTSISNPLFSIVSCSSTRAVCRPIYLWLIQLTSFYIWLFVQQITSGLHFSVV